MLALVFSFVNFASAQNGNESGTILHHIAIGGKSGGHWETVLQVKNKSETETWNFLIDVHEQNGDLMTVRYIPGLWAENAPREENWAIFGTIRPKAIQYITLESAVGTNDVKAGWLRLFQRTRTNPATVVSGSPDLEFFLYFVMFKDDVGREEITSSQVSYSKPDLRFNLPSIIKYTKWDGGKEDANTAIALMNPNTTATSVKLTLRTTNGKTVTEQLGNIPGYTMPEPAEQIFDIPANSSVSFFLTEKFKKLSNPAQGVPLLVSGTVDVDSGLPIYALVLHTRTSLDGHFRINTAPATVR